MSADEQPSASAAPAGLGAVDASYRGLGGPGRRNSLALLRIVVLVLGLLLIVGSATHIVPAVRAGLHEGTRGYWIVTGQTCTRKACLWIGKFVLPNGHVQLARAQYSGTFPPGMHTGTRIAALAPGGGLVFPVTGSDLWISLLIALVVGLLGVYWASHRWVAAYLRKRADNTGLAAPLR